MLSPGTEETVFYHAMKFTQSWGGNYVYWDPAAEIRWFGIKGKTSERFKPMEDKYEAFPTSIYTSRFNYDSLVLIKNNIYALQNDSLLSETQKKLHLQLINENLDYYTLSIKKEKPFLYYIQAPLRLVKKFFIHSGTYNLLNKQARELNFLEYGVKVFYSLFYYFILIFGFTGLVLLIKKSILLHSDILVTGIIIYVSVVHPIILRFCEARYFAPAWPFLILASTFCIQWFYNKTIVKLNFSKNNE